MGAKDQEMSEDEVFLLLANTHACSSTTIACVRALARSLCLRACCLHAVKHVSAMDWQLVSSPDETPPPDSPDSFAPETSNSEARVSAQADKDSGGVHGGGEGAATTVQNDGSGVDVMSADANDEMDGERGAADKSEPGETCSGLVVSESPAALDESGNDEVSVQFPSNIFCVYACVCVVCSFTVSNVFERAKYTWCVGSQRRRV